MALCFIFFLSFTFFFLFYPQSAVAAISLSSFNASNSPWHPNQNLTLLSRNSIFSAGFLPTSNSRNLYVFSVWNSKIPKDNVVWSANPGSPVSASASLSISSKGEIFLNNSSGKNLWPSGKVSTNATHLTLYDNGNLEFGDWESFKLPANTILPNQSLVGVNISSHNGKFKFINSSTLILVSPS